MTLPRIFVPQPLQVNQEIMLDQAASWHLLQVLRLPLGSRLLLFNNTGGEFKAQLITIVKKQAVAYLEEFSLCATESPLAIHLGQGISRGEKMDFTIQKAVELGVQTITPIFTLHCNVKLEGERLAARLHHWHKVAISAAEQSGRCYVPAVLPSHQLAFWYKTKLPGLRLVCDPAASIKLSHIVERPQAVTLLVGPEGGLSPEEISLARDHQFVPVTLGPRVLRTETGALTALSILQALWGDL